MTRTGEVSTAMAREIAEIPIIAEMLLSRREEICAIAGRIKAFNPGLVVLCGRGSSGHVGVFLRYLFEVRAGLLVSTAAPSVVTAYRQTHDMRRMVFLVISQSGRSPDLVLATRQARDSGALTVALVNDRSSPVSDAAELVLPIEAGHESAVAATKTVVLSMVRSAQLVAELTGDRDLEGRIANLPARFEAALACDWSDWTHSLDFARAAFVIGRGFGLAAAKEIALKLTETLSLPAFGYSAAEFRHGPLAALTSATPLLALRLEDESASLVDALVQEAKASDLPVFAAGGSTDTLPWIGDDHAVCDAIVMLLPAYMAIERTARRLGLDPDRPPNIRKVTETL